MKKPLPLTVDSDLIDSDLRPAERLFIAAVRQYSVKGSCSLSREQLSGIVGVLPLQITKITNYLEESKKIRRVYPLGRNKERFIEELQWQKKK